MIFSPQVNFPRSSNTFSKLSLRESRKIWLKEKSFLERKNFPRLNWKLCNSRNFLNRLRIASRRLLLALAFQRCCFFAFERNAKEKMDARSNRRMKYCTFWASDGLRLFMEYSTSHFTLERERKRERQRGRNQNPLAVRALQAEYQGSTCQLAAQKCLLLFRDLWALLFKEIFSPKFDIPPRSAKLHLTFTVLLLGI